MAYICTDEHAMHRSGGKCDNSILWKKTIWYKAATIPCPPLKYVFDDNG